ncbi:MAG: hypothetical protein V4710_05965 [Verrucomicrobiota bacterium]
MKSREILKRHFDGEDGTFLIIARCELRWDWQAFRELTSAMCSVAADEKGGQQIERWVAHGFWFCDTWIREWTGHPDFPRPEQQAYEDAIELIHDLAYYLFLGESPYEDDALQRKSKGQEIASVDILGGES